MTTCAPLTADHGAVQLTFFQEESPAKDSAEQASSSESSTPATSGLTRSASSRNAARRGSSSKTWTALHRSTIGASFSKTLRRQGMMLAGACCPLEMWVLPIFGNAYGSSQLIPTPSAINANEGEKLATWEARRLATKERVGNGNGFGTPLSIYVQQWPTPCARDHFPPHKPEYIAAKKAQGHGMSNLNDAAALRTTWASPASRDYRSGKGRQENGHTPQLPEQVGGLLNPTWVEWLMGWPIDWTDPDGGPSSEDFHEWLESNRTALTVYVASAMVRFHSAKPSPGNSSADQIQ